MSTNDEYESLKAQRRDAQARYNATLGRIEECDYKISRLKRTKAILTEQKRTFASIKKNDKDIVDKKKRSAWSGSCFSSFRSSGGALIDTNEGFYRNSLDGALDAVNDEITRLENQKYNEYGLLGRLSSTINSLANKIENFFN